jgi:hypothetical protein
MSLEEAILYAQQRMCEIGIHPDDYHFEAIKVMPTADELEEGIFYVRAYNEIYILIDKGNYKGVFIQADNSCYHTDDPLDCGVNEFTGLIIFSKYDAEVEWSFRGETIESFAESSAGSGGVPMEFLRVVY